jgi:hypothetical protein
MAKGGKRKRSKWIIHVMATNKANPGKAFKDILKMAAKTYKKSPETKVHGKPKKTTHKTSKKGRKGKKRRKKHKGGGDLADDAGVVSEPSSIGGTDCPLPAKDNSGSITNADLSLCGGLGASVGGKRKHSKRKSSKRKSSKRKSSKRKSSKRKSSKRKH